MQFCLVHVLIVTVNSNIKFSDKKVISSFDDSMSSLSNVNIQGFGVIYDQLTLSDFKATSFRDATERSHGRR